MRLRFNAFVSLSLLALPVPLFGKTLLGGKYETSSDVQNFLNLALDTAAMRETDDLIEKLSIYQNGVAADQSLAKVTLQSLSLGAKDDMGSSPMFNIFRHAFWVLGHSVEDETEGLFDGKPVEQYGDTIVNDLFSLNINHIETEAALVTSVWMACVHQLFQVMLECRAGDKVRGLVALDIFAALWIGEGQEDGNNERGSMLYNLAENAGERFGQDDGETTVNTRLLELLDSLHSKLSNNKCADEEEHQAMRPVVKEMISIMTIPLVQNLIHHTMNLQADGASDFVELYALATIPRLAACDPAAFEDELRIDILGTLQQDQVADTIKSIMKTYRCFDITCAQVGSYLGGSIPECSDETEVVVAGYTTDRRDARQKANLDRDIKAIDIFLQFQAYGAAEDWYRHGWNSIYSLQEVATNEVVPSLVSGSSSYMDLFTAYYEGSTFADDMITGILEQVSPYNGATPGQIRNMMTGTLQYVVMFATIASSFQYAVEMCSVDKDIALQFWDTGALFYIGSMEGSSTGGNIFGGEGMFSTAKELCTEFGTCVAEGSENNGLTVAASNEVLVGGLIEVQYLINSGSCVVAKKILDEQILSSLIIPLIQGTIKYASYNADLEAGTTDSTLAIGDTFARGILPMVDQVDSEAATVIYDNTVFQLSEQPVADGFTIVANALRTALAKMSTSCVEVGNFEDEPEDGDMCSAQSTGGSDSSTEAGTGTIQDLAFGRFIFHNDLIAERDSSFALDVQGMFQAQSPQDAQQIYAEGSPSRFETLTGDTNMASLKAFSRHALEKMEEDPMFNIYRYALYEDSDLEEVTIDAFAFADDIISESFEQAQDSKLSAEAAVVMNIWMMIVHRLYAASRKCGDEENPAGLIDSAVALWIGKGQQEGKFERGWGMYSVAQSAAMFYGLAEGEAKVNTDLMQLFNQAQQIGHQCHLGPQYAEAMYFTVNELVRTLSKPLILNLLFHMVGDSRNMMELYAASVVPQAVVCDEENLEMEVFSKSFNQGSFTEAFLDDVATFLRCQRITADDLLHSQSVPEAFSDFLSALIERLESGTGGTLNANPSRTGYASKTDVSEISRLDMDVQEIKILMRTRAYRAAKHVYKYGHNAYDESKTGYLSLQALATRASSPSEELPQEIYSKYYSTEFVADDVMNAAIYGSDDFSNATRGELAVIVVRTLQTMVSFDAILAHIKSARENCVEESESTDLLKAVGQWDQAAAYFLGSIDRSVLGESESDGSLFGLAQSVCADFGKCRNSSVAQDLLIQFAAGRDAISEASCDRLLEVEDSITPLLSTILIQATLADILHLYTLGDAGADTTGSLYVLGMAVIPLVAQSNKTSAEILESTLGNFETLTTDRPVSQIFKAFSYALGGMGINCTNVGIPVSNPDLTLCFDGGVNEVTVPLGSPTNLGNGLYISSTYVQDRANIARDVQELQEAIDDGSYEMAKLIYKDGKNSKVYDENGVFQSLRSLKSLSVEESEKMKDEPLFNMFKYALQNDHGNFLSHEVSFYADSILQDTFSNLDDETKTLPVEAILSLNLWMYIVHILYKTLSDCRNQRIHTDEGIHSLEVAAAYWIGDIEVEGNSPNGHLLYAMAEKASEAFQWREDVEPTSTNTKMLNLFHEARNEFSDPKVCSGNAASYLSLSNHVHKIVSTMTIPLIQNLIHNLRENDRERVKIYSYAVIPLTASCKAETFAYLDEKLLQMKYTEAEVDALISELRSLYPCLGLSCSDIGTHVTETSRPDLPCVDPASLESMAGYGPMSPVRNVAQLDLDMRQMDVLLEMDAFEAVETLYTYGKHSSLPYQDGTVSLFGMAISHERSIVPEFDAFVKYYGGYYSKASRYADHIIREALNGTEYSWTTEQRRVIALKSMQVLIMYFGTLEPLYEAIVACDHGDSGGDLWDQGAALWIGSLKDTEEDVARTPMGYFYFDLAQEHCHDFGTCQPDGSSAQVNDRMLGLLYAGRGAITRNSCSTALDAIPKISKLLLIPVIQGALSSAIHLQLGSKKTMDVDRANAYVHSRALLPLVALVDADAAKVIDTQLGYPAPSTTSRTALQVFSALAKVYKDIGVDCRMIGTMKGYNACKGGPLSRAAEKSMAGIALGTILVLLALGGGCTFVIRRRQTERKLPENNPRFIIPETGEMNHSMDLLEKAFSKRSFSSRTESITFSKEKRPLTENIFLNVPAMLEEHDTSSASSSNEDSLEVL